MGSIDAMVLVFDDLLPVLLMTVDCWWPLMVLLMETIDTGNCCCLLIPVQYWLVIVNVLTIYCDIDGDYSLWEIVKYSDVDILPWYIDMMPLLWLTTVDVDWLKAICCIVVFVIRGWVPLVLYWCWYHWHWWWYYWLLMTVITVFDMTVFCDLVVLLLLLLLYHDDVMIRYDDEYNWYCSDVPLCYCAVCCRLEVH